MLKQELKAPHAAIIALRVFKILKTEENLYEGIRYDFLDHGFDLGQIISWVIALPRWIFINFEDYLFIIIEIY